MCRKNTIPTDDLRIPSPRKGKSVSIRINGQSIRAFAGETIHAALIAAGIQVMRMTGSGELRGVFCGMGICYDCLVTVDSIPDQRACMTMVREGMEISLPGAALSSEKSELSVKGSVR